MLILENVANLKGHDGGNTWKRIETDLQANYYVKAEILSPHQFGIPQHRKRIYIVCRRKDLGSLDYFSFPQPTDQECDINSIIDPSDTNYTPLREDTVLQLDMWQEFINNTIKSGYKIPRFPIWAMEFGATYNFKEKAPAYQTHEELIGKKGKLGQVVNGITKEDCLLMLPNYAQTDKSEVFPKWKIRYIEQNREFYAANKVWLDDWIKKVISFDNSHLKLEWNCGDAEPTMQDKIIQFRASGLRVKAPTFSPALNLVGTQVPILPWIKLPNREGYGRYMTVREAAKLQGMDHLKFGNDIFQLSQTRTYEALGNAVNVIIVKEIAKSNVLRIHG
ncbi:MAG: DNA cytosine methyltransferase [Bacteroidales bacterium]|nr:DNA cytosine methyltransferase [Bacteroidales bacterium]